MGIQPKGCLVNFLPYFRRLWLGFGRSSDVLLDLFRTRHSPFLCVLFPLVIFDCNTDNDLMYRISGSLVPHLGANLTCANALFLVARIILHRLHPRVIPSWYFIYVNAWLLWPLIIWIWYIDIFTIICRYVLQDYLVVVILRLQFDITFLAYLLAHRYFCIPFPYVNLGMLTIIPREVP